MATTIFPGLISDLDLKILSFCHTAAQLQLGRVNRRGNEVLTNQFFIDRFYVQHPLLTTYEKLCCALLRSAHETNGGKVMCKALDPEYRAQFPGRFSSTFVEDGARFEKGKLLVKRRPFEVKNRAICGSHYEDSSSPIDKAWKKYKRLEGEAEVFRLEYSLRAESVVQKVEKAKKKYDKLEIQRITACNRIEMIDMELASFPQKHETKITSELTHALSLENALKNKLHLDACVALIITVGNNPEEKTLENLARIRDLINSCTYEQETEKWEEYCIWGALIWRELYFRSSKGVIEDSWAENHFKDHLHALFSIVQEKRELMRQRIAFADLTQATLS